MPTGLLGTEVIPINPLLNPQPVMNSFGYSNPRANIGNSNRILGNVIPGMLPLTAFGLISQAGNIFNNEPMSAQDVINSHLSQENNYKTWDFGYTNQMSETEARNRGIIIPPDPTVTAEERKRNLTLPNIPPEMEQGWVEDFPIEESKPTILSTPVLEPGEQGSIETLPFEKPDIGSMILHTEGLLKDEKVTSGILDETAPPFYSKIKKTIEDAKMEKGSADQWTGYINNAGVNQEELDWIGLKDYLADKKSVTKEDVLNFVEMNDLAVQVKDIVLGAESDAIRFTGDTMEMIEGQGTTLTHDPRVPEILRNAAGYQDAKNIVMNDEGLYNQYQEYLRETEQQTADDPITYFLQDEFGMFRGSSDQGKTMFNRPELITEGDYTDYKEMVFQLPSESFLMSNEEYKNAEKEFKDYSKILAEKYDLNPLHNLAMYKTLNNMQQNEVDEYERLQHNWLNLKEQKLKEGYIQGHYSKYPNTFAHARFNTRDVDGKKTLFIEELQSDWVHKGKERGYQTKEYKKQQEELQTKRNKILDERTNLWKEIDKLNVQSSVYAGSIDSVEIEKIQAPIRKKINELTLELKEVDSKFTDNLTNVPDIPFKKNWQDIVLKRLIRYASENGFDAIAMTGGSIQADRYDLSKYIDSVKIIASDKAEGKIHLIAGNELDLHIYPDQLEEHIGKDLAKKIKNDLKEKNILENYKEAKILEQKGEFINWDKTIPKGVVMPTTEYLEYKGLDLKIGGEGLKSMYDKIFSKSLNKIGKKFDAKLIEKDIWTKSEDLKEFYEKTPDADKQKMKEFYKNIWFMDITPSMKKKAIEAGFPIAYNKPVNPLFQFA